MENLIKSSEKGKTKEEFIKIAKELGYTDKDINGMIKEQEQMVNGGFKGGYEDIPLSYQLY